MMPTERPDTADLTGVPDSYLSMWLNILDRRLITQLDEPVHADVTDYMKVWNEIARRDGQPPTALPFTEVMAADLWERE